MGYVDTYWLDCDEPVNYSGQACIDFEYGKVRSAALVRRRYLATIMAAPANLSVWNTGISAGNVIVLPRVSGSFDPGEPIALKGYGRRLATRGPRTMALTVNDPRYSLNYGFYNGIHRKQDYVVAFRTSSVLHIADVPADLFSKNVIDEDLQATIAWETKATWRSSSLPLAIDFAPIASLFYTT